MRPLLRSCMVFAAAMALVATIGCGGNGNKGGGAGAGGSGGAGGGGGSGGAGGAPACVQNPMTSQELLNGCTDAQTGDPNKDYPYFPANAPNGKLPPLN